jgi:acyl-CoA dehydrogenase
MRSIGSAEKALEWFLARINDERKKPFGELLNKHGIMLERVARSRIEIDAARLAVLNAAIKIDETNAKGALKEIAEVKVLVPEVNLKVIDWAIQAYGGAGVSQDTPLANMYASGRTMRIVDGPDEVHLLQLGRNENKRGVAHKNRIDAQKKRGDELCRQYGIEPLDPLYLNRTSAEAAKL